MTGKKRDDLDDEEDDNNPILDLMVFHNVDTVDELDDALQCDDKFVD